MNVAKRGRSLKLVRVLDIPQYFDLCRTINIGGWEVVMEAMSYMAILTNLTLFAFSSPHLIKLFSGFFETSAGTEAGIGDIKTTTSTTQDIEQYVSAAIAAVLICGFSWCM